MRINGNDIVVVRYVTVFLDKGPFRIDYLEITRQRFIVGKRHTVFTKSIWKVYICWQNCLALGINYLTKYSSYFHTLILEKWFLNIGWMLETTIHVYYNAFFLCVRGGGERCRIFYLPFVWWPCGLRCW